MISRPPEWDFSVNGLIACLKEGREAVQSTIKELIQFGIMEREKTHDAQGRIIYNYTIYQNPKQAKDKENCDVSPRTGNPSTVKPCTANQQQVNIDKVNIDKEIIKTTKKDFVEEIKRPDNVKGALPKDAGDELWDLYCDIWNVFPKKRKGTCADGWAAMKAAIKKHNPTIDEIKNGVQSYINSDEANKENQKYATSVQKFFNKQKWNETYEPYKPLSGTTDTARKTKANNLASVLHQRQTQTGNGFTPQGREGELAVVDAMEFGLLNR